MYDNSSSSGTEIVKLYDAYREWFVATITSVYHLDKETVLDIYQESFFELYVKCTTEKTEIRFVRAYLLRIGKNIACNYIRDNRITLKAEMSETEGVIYADETWEYLEEKKIVKDTIDSAISKVNGICERIFRLFYWERKSLKEISKELGHKDEQVTKSAKYKCKKKLKIYLERELKKAGINLENLWHE